MAARPNHSVQRTARRRHVLLQSQLIYSGNNGSGERGRNRTFNLVIKSHLLCQLSYAPDCSSTNLIVAGVNFGYNKTLYHCRPIASTAAETRVSHTTLPA